METALGVFLAVIAAAIIVFGFIKLLQKVFDRPEFKYQGPVVLPPEIYPPEQPKERPEKPELDPNTRRVAPKAARGRIYEKDTPPGVVVVKPKGKAKIKVEKVWRKDTGQWEDPYERDRKALERDKKYAYKHKQRGANK